MSTDIILEKSDQYARIVYKLTRDFPKSEIFGLTSQLRRSALSVPLNIIEGYARQSPKSEAQFLTIAYGSLKESQYLLQFALGEKYLKTEDVTEASRLGDEIARMIWRKNQTLRNKF